EYLDVVSATPLDYATKYAEKSQQFDVIMFDEATPAEMPKTNALYLDPRGPGSPFKVENEIVMPGFDKIDRKHPIVRFVALDSVNIARGHKLKAEPQDKVIGASEQGPILVSGNRGGHKMVAMGFDIRESDLPLRVAWPVLLLNIVNYFTDEDASYLSSFRTGDVWRIPVGQSASQATLTLPGGASQPIPVHEGRAVYLGQRSGFYDLALGGAGGAAPAPKAPGDKDKDVTTAGADVHFAANLLDDAESTIAPAEKLTVDGKDAGRVSAFHVGVKREWWIYLLIAAVLITFVEWITYHRRITV
ncbi:MAG TPA: VWA domain-containing protein, partial [Polyangiaceae bacterium]|nr:VWA domain-containing protein [Polyangiaceae bacterium]